jgi:hypothetical protein
MSRVGVTSVDGGRLEIVKDGDCQEKGDSRLARCNLAIPGRRTLCLSEREEENARPTSGRGRTGEYCTIVDCRLIKSQRVYILRVSMSRWWMIVLFGLRWMIASVWILRERNRCITQTLKSGTLRSATAKQEAHSYASRLFSTRGA